MQAEGWADVHTVAFPSRCGRPPVQWDELRKDLPEGCTDVIIFGRACLASLGQAPAEFPATRLQVQEQCFHMIAGTRLVEVALAEGAYLMSPGWLDQWEKNVKELGFTRETVGEFFQDFAQGLVLLDTEVRPSAMDSLSAFQAAVGLPARRIAVGLDYLRLLMERVVLEWRLTQLQLQGKQQQSQHATELADHILAMDLLGRITRSRTETDVITAIEDMFRMLFAPSAWYYLPEASHIRSAESEVPTSVTDEVRALKSAYGWTASGSGFILRVGRDEHLLGHIVVDGLAFPQYRERYLNLALAMANMMAFAIESARTRVRLAEAEKMASLGVMVAGVAHEINTPVGVGVLAASTLQARTEGLAQSFSQRRMTQADLQGYLKDSSAQSALILSNLERVGGLIDKFRQVAVNGLPQAKTRFRVKACLDDVIQSFGDRIPAAGIEVHVLCDESLELESYPGDWSSIFTNFIANSLQHGFKGRDSGHIQVKVVQESASMSIVYSDDGNGLSAQARERIFDPFFTTDMQSGIGLGMHLVYNLITQRLHGHISVQGQPASGVSFLMEIPHQPDARALV
jgi:signal transduction histidine kinase